MSMGLGTEVNFALYGPEVDLIVPAFNRLAFLKPFFDLIEGQEYAHLHVYFTCGKSHDGTEDALRDLVKARTQVKIDVAFVDNMSLGAMRNYWLNKNVLLGKYVAFMDIDDSFKKN